MDETPDMLFVDVAAVARTVRDALPSEEQARFDTDTAPNLGPVTAVVLTGESGPDRASARLFVLIR